MAAVAVCGEDRSQAEEGGSEFHGRRWASWIGEGGCFGGTDSHTFSSNEPNIHPSIDARNPRNSSLSRHPEFSWRPNSHLFVVWPQNNGNPTPTKSDSALLAGYRPH